MITMGAMLYLIGTVVSLDFDWITTGWFQKRPRMHSESTKNQNVRRMGLDTKNMQYVARTSKQASKQARDCAPNGTLVWETSTAVVAVLPHNGFPLPLWPVALQ